MLYSTGIPKINEFFICSKLNSLGVKNFMHITKFSFSVQELCTIHRLDAGTMASEWMAFKLSHKVAAMDFDILQNFEREVILETFIRILRSFFHSRQRPYALVNCNHGIPHPILEYR